MTDLIASTIVHAISKSPDYPSRRPVDFHFAWQIATCAQYTMALQKCIPAGMIMLTQMLKGICTLASLQGTRPHARTLSHCGQLHLQTEQRVH
jgi:hypothetical protein